MATLGSREASSTGAAADARNAQVQQMPLEPVRIAYVTMQFPSPSETFACSDVRALVAQGIPLTVYGMRAPHEHHAAMLKERLLEDIEIHQFSTRQALRGLANMIRHPAWTVSLIAWIARWAHQGPRLAVRSMLLVPSAIAIFADLQRHDPDVVHLFWGHYPSMVGFLSARFRKDSVLTTFLGAYDLRLEYPGSRSVASHAAVTWTHAKSNVEALRRLGVPAENICVAYRGIDLIRVEAALASVGGSRFRNRIVAAGRLTSEKGIADVIRVFGLLRARVPDASLVILGDGPDRAALEQDARNSGHAHAIQFLGHVPHDEVLRQMAQAEAFLHLSKTERLPNVVKEAMALGCACVVRRTHGIDELIQHGESGIIVEKDDHSATVRSIERLLTDEAYREKLRTVAIAHIRTHFDVRRVMREYHTIWVELSKRHRAGNT